MTKLRNVADFLCVVQLFRETVNKMSTPRPDNSVIFYKERVYYYSAVHEKNFQLFRSQKRDFITVYKIAKQIEEKNWHAGNQAKIR